MNSVHCGQNVRLPIITRAETQTRQSATNRTSPASTCLTNAIGLPSMHSIDYLITPLTYPCARIESRGKRERRIFLQLAASRPRNTPQRFIEDFFVFVERSALPGRYSPLSYKQRSSDGRGPSKTAPVSLFDVRISVSLNARSLSTVDSDTAPRSKNPHLIPARRATPNTRKRAPFKARNARPVTALISHMRLIGRPYDTRPKNICATRHTPYALSAIGHANRTMSIYEQVR